MIEIKKAEKKDAKEISELASIVWHEHFIPIIGLAQVEYMLDKFQSEKAIGDSIENQGYVYYMAYVDGNFAGYMGIHKDDKAVLLSKIYIHSDFRRKGVTKTLLKHVMDTYDDCNLFWLTVNKYNDIAIESYKKLGFKTERESVTDIGNGFVMDDYVMAIRR